MTGNQLVVAFCNNSLCSYFDILPTPKLFVDNQSSLKILESEKSKFKIQPHSRQIFLCSWFKIVKLNQIWLSFDGSNACRYNIFTKALSTIKFVYFRNMLGLINKKLLILLRRGVEIIFCAIISLHLVYIWLFCIISEYIIISNYFLL